MAVASTTLERISGAFFDALRLYSDTDSEARQSLGGQLDEIAALLPEPDAWTVFGDGDDARVLLLADDALFTLGRQRGSGGTREFVVASHPAQVTEVGYRRSNEETFWKFQFRFRDSLGVNGRVDSSGEPDGPEVFARVLAGRGGWATETANP